MNSLTWTPSTLRFTGSSEHGDFLQIDGKSEAGISPMDVLLQSLAACTGIDMVTILERMRQPLEGLRIEVGGTREEFREAKPWKTVEVKFYLKGDLDPAKVQRAMDLSFEKYCSVSLTLRGNVTVSGSFEIEAAG